MHHICFDSASMRLMLLDQRYLPQKEDMLVCRSWMEAVEAIKNMAVRGAPAIGVVAAYACAMAAHELADCDSGEVRLSLALNQIKEARPTAVNLAWAVDRMAAVTAPDPRELAKKWVLEAQRIHREDVSICRAIGQAGHHLIADGDTVLTHCNAGALATGGYGTALGVIRAARENGKTVRVIADETRPFLQGARLTAWELEKDGIPVTIVCDNACATLLASGEVKSVIVGADRIAANGDTANKIGTLGVAIIAAFYNIPFYVAAPLSSIDASLSHGGLIPIEQRPQTEVLQFMGEKVGPENVPACNYAFDVTPARLITGIITELGVARPPYETAIAQFFASPSFQMQA